MYIELEHNIDCFQPNIQDDVALLGAAPWQDVPPGDHERGPQLHVELLHDLSVEDVAGRGGSLLNGGSSQLTACYTRTHLYPMAI